MISADHHHQNLRLAIVGVNPYPAIMQCSRDTYALKQNRGRVVWPRFN